MIVEHLELLKTLVTYLEMVTSYTINIDMFYQYLVTMKKKLDQSVINLHSILFSFTKPSI